jgi:hypothetical protein
MFKEQQGEAIFQTLHALTNSSCFKWNHTSNDEKYLKIKELIVADWEVVYLFLWSPERQQEYELPSSFKLSVAILTRFWRVKCGWKW